MEMLEEWLKRRKIGRDLKVKIRTKKTEKISSSLGINGYS